MGRDVSRVVDLSRVIEDGMETDPRLPPPRVRDVWTRDESAPRYAPGVSFQIARIDICQNTGTYLDAPFHRYERGSGVWNTPIERTAHLPGVRIDVRDVARRPRPMIEPDDLPHGVLGGAAVLLWSGFDQRWDDPAYRDGRHPCLSADAAEALADRGAALVGIDAINLDDTGDPRRPAHSILLERDVLIVENLCGLGALPERGFRFTAAPLKIRGFGACPVRAFAVLDS